MDVPDHIQHCSTPDPQPLRSPTPEAVALPVGRAWVTDSPEERQETLTGAPAPAPPGPQVYGDRHLPPRHTHGPHNLPEVWAATWKQLRPQRLTSDTAMVVLMAKNPSKRPP